MAGRRYFNDDIFYTIFKKHYCPVCGTKLTRIKTSKIVNSKSPEAKNYDFTLGDSFMVGDVEFIWKEFYCPICKKRIPIDEMKRIERGQGDGSIVPKNKEHRGRFCVLTNRSIK